MTYTRLVNLILEKFTFTNPEVIILGLTDTTYILANSTVREKQRDSRSWILTTTKKCVLQKLATIKRTGLS